MSARDKEVDLWRVIREEMDDMVKSGEWTIDAAIFKILRKYGW